MASLPPTAVLAYAEARAGYEGSDVFSRVVEASRLDCAGAMFHSPRPLTLQSSPITPPGTPLVDVVTVHLCGTCRENLSIYQALLVAHDGEVPWGMRREFGNMIRALGEQGWSIYRESR